MLWGPVAERKDESWACKRVQKRLWRSSGFVGYNTLSVPSFIHSLSHWYQPGITSYNLQILHLKWCICNIICTQVGCFHINIRAHTIHSTSVPVPWATTLYLGATIILYGSLWSSMVHWMQVIQVFLSGICAKMSVNYKGKAWLYFHCFLLLGSFLFRQGVLISLTLVWNHSC